MTWMPRNAAVAVVDVAAVVAAAAAVNGNLDPVPLTSTQATIHPWQVTGTLFLSNKGNHVVYKLELSHELALPLVRTTDPDIALGGLLVVVRSALSCGQCLPRPRRRPPIPPQPRAEEHCAARQRGTRTAGTPR